MQVIINGVSHDTHSIEIKLENGEDFQLNADNISLFIRALHSSMVIRPMSENCIKVIPNS